jgi:hypothetical protein
MAFSPFLASLLRGGFEKEKGVRKENLNYEEVRAKRDLTPVP